MPMPMLTGWAGSKERGSKTNVGDDSFLNQPKVGKRKGEGRRKQEE
jgi:hypothetical protein